MRIAILRVGNSIRVQQGFTYIVLLAALVILGITAEVLSRSSVIQKQRQLEKELLFRGKAYYDAIESYYHSSQFKQFPKHIDDLLYDNRFAHKRHLRKIYVDPITGGEWRLLRNSSGGIVGVASTSEKQPLKQAHFLPPHEHFIGAEHYHQWEFRYLPDLAPKSR